MQVIAAIALTDENILEYRVKADPYSVWDSTTVYRRGRKVIVQDGYNKIYESVYPHSGMYPPDNTGQEQPAWILVRPINLWSMLGSVPDQRTQNNDEIYLKLAPKARVNAIGVHGVEANYINVKVWDAQANLVEDRTVNLNYTTTHDSAVVTGRYTDTVIVRLPEHPQGVIEVTLAAPGEKVFCETMTFGEARALGTTQPSARVTGIDPSLKAFDVFGRAYVQKRDMERSVSASVIIPWRNLDYSHKALADLRATPATWVASDTTPISIVYGMYRDFEINLSNRQVGLCNLDIQPIYYEPIRPPAVPIGDPVYFTSRPYPITDIQSLASEVPLTDSAILALPALARESQALEMVVPSIPELVGGSVEEYYRLVDTVGEESLGVAAPSLEAELRKILVEYPEDTGGEYGDAMRPNPPLLVSGDKTTKYIGYNKGVEWIAPVCPTLTSGTLSLILKKTSTIDEGIQPITPTVSGELRLIMRSAGTYAESVQPTIPTLLSAELRSIMRVTEADTDSTQPDLPTLLSAELLAILKIVEHDRDDISVTLPTLTSALLTTE